MPKVLTDKSEILCEPVSEEPPLHGGKIIGVAGTAKLTVNGDSIVLVKANLVGKKVQGCITPDNPPNSSPCKKVVSVTASESSKLTVGKVPVMLEGNIEAKTDGLPQATLLVATAEHSILTAK